MSESTTPISPLFELQRETLKRGADILQFPRELRNEFVEDGLAASEQIQRQTIDLIRQAVQETLSTVGALQGQERTGQRETIDELFDALLDQHEAAYETIEETYEQADTETLTREVEQLDLLLELNQRIETELERAVEQVEKQTASDDRRRELTDVIEHAISAAGAADIPTMEAEATEIPIRTPGSASDGDEANESESEDDSGSDGQVECRVCGESFGAITYSHLQTHEMTVDEYRSEFGEDVPL